MGVPATDNASAMINYLLLRHGVSDTGDADARAQCLSWVQRAEEDVWGYSNWWFKEVEAALAWKTGEDTYTVVDARAVYGVKLSTGMPLDRLSPRDFHLNFGDHGDVLDTPMVWTGLPQSEGLRYQRIKVWPAPKLGLGTGLVVKDLAHRDLADDVESVSQVPADWRGVVLVRADCLMAEHFGQLDLMAARQAEYEGLLGLLAAEDSRHMKEGG